MKVKKLQKFGNKSGLMYCKWSSLNAPGNGNPLSHSVSSWMDSLFPLLALWVSGLITIGSPVWKWKSCKNFRTKWVEWAANGPVWMPQALETLCLIQFWVTNMLQLHQTLSVTDSLILSLCPCLWASKLQHFITLAAFNKITSSKVWMRS